MSFNLGSFSKKLSFKAGNNKVTEGGEGGETKDGAVGEDGQPTGSAASRKTKPKKKLLQFQAKTDDYVDDSDLFKARISVPQKMEYWAHLLSNKGKRDLPKGHKSWIQQELMIENELANYPSKLVSMFNLVKSNRWDQIYLDLFLLILILIIAVEDGWADAYAPIVLTFTEGGFIYVMISAAMLGTQLVPILGILYYMNYCNDLALFVASESFQQWAFSAALIAQFIEFSYYSGRGKYHLAGRCRIADAESKFKFDDGISMRYPTRKHGLLSRIFCCCCFNICRKQTPGDLRLSQVGISADSADSDIGSPEKRNAGMGFSDQAKENNIKEGDIETGGAGMGQQQQQEKGGKMMGINDIDGTDHEENGVDYKGKKRKGEGKKKNTQHKKDKKDKNGAASSAEEESAGDGDTDAESNAKPSEGIQGKKKHHTSKNNNNNNNDRENENVKGDKEEGDEVREKEKIGKREKKKGKKEKKTKKGRKGGSGDEGAKSGEEREEEEEGNQKNGVAREEEEEVEEDTGGEAVDGKKRRKNRPKSEKSRRKSTKSGRISTSSSSLSASKKRRKKRASMIEKEGEYVPTEEEQKEIDAKKKRDAEEAEARKVEYMDWKCITCGTENHQPKHPEILSDIVFGTKGLYYKRTYAVIQPRRDMPVCKKCYTDADYQPPLCSSHLFPRNPNLYAAFEEYPKRPRIQAGFKEDGTFSTHFSAFYHSVRSFFFGMDHSVDSAALQNDWRLRKLVRNQFPEIPRVKLENGDFFRVGEIVECRQQKSEWARARVTEVHPKNHTYNLRYDPGDEIRFVLESSIRTRPEKRAYAYQVEVGMVLLVTLFPVGILAAFSGSPGLLLIGPLVSFSGLLGIRLFTVVKYMCNYYAAGLCQILGLSTLYTLPIFFCWLGSVLAAADMAGSDPNTWVSVSILFILGKIFSLVVLYMMRPAFVIVALILFVQSCAGLYLAAQYISGGFEGGFVAAALAPLITLTLSLKYLRAHLHNVWDVCLVIRPVKDISEDNPSLYGQIMDSCNMC